MTRKEVAKFLQSATSAVVLPERAPVSIDEVRRVAALGWAKCWKQADGSVYVQCAKESYEARA